jgi:glycosyltransferase involved in cell wall biosynthesis
MRIALIGTRGVPARYGGFETAVEEIGMRLVAAGNQVTVYSRGPFGNTKHLGMDVVNLPTLRLKATDTLVHTLLTAIHAGTRRYDAAIVFNAANALPALLLKCRRLPYAVHMDGLEWKRLKWGAMGRKYYLASERLATQTANALIADAKGIQEYYSETYQAGTVYIPYGTPEPKSSSAHRLSELELSAGKFHLIVARFEPENYVDLGVAGYVRSDAIHPLVVVGAAPYGAAYVERVHAAASGDSRVRFLGSIWDQELLDSLYSHARSYIHGHSVGGTNPSLLRGMGLGTTVLAYDVNFNREVLGPTGRYFASAEELAGLIAWTEASPTEAATLARTAQTRARAHFNWEDVATRYATLCEQLRAAGWRGYVADASLDI